MKSVRPVEDDAWRLRQASSQSLGKLMNTEPSLVAALRNCTRTGGRLADAVSARLGAMPDAISSAQEHLLCMDVSSLAAFSTRVGAVRNAAGLLRIIDGATLRDLAACLGEGIMPLAIRWSHLAGEAPPNRSLSLAEQVVFTGLQGLHGWCNLQPRALGERIRLLLPATEAGAAMEDAFGARIVDALVTADA